MYLRIWNEKVKLTSWYATQPYPKKTAKNLTKKLWAASSNQSIKKRC